MKKFACIWIFLLLISGCINKRTVYTPKVDNSAEIQIAEAAESISKSLVKLASIQENATPPAKNKKLVNPDSWGLQGTASIDWSGPIEPLVKHICQVSKYTFRKLGQEPRIPIMITINSKNKPLAHILRDVHYLANDKAEIHVDQKKKVIELRYARI